MSAINLTKDLEALYYFDEQNFDSQRNLLRDHSGYGRHATASGGPTVGVEGPNDFGATSFDGTDDNFTSSGKNNLGSNIITVGIYAKFPNDGGVYSSNNHNVRMNQGELICEISTIGDKQSANAFLNNPDSYAWHFYVYDNGNIRFYENEQLRDTMPISGTYKDMDFSVLAEYTGKNNHGALDVAVWGEWGRLLSSNERRQLSRLTAPRRAQL